MKAAQLRKSILQTAVQGKLVPQSSHDEPAVKLLKSIYAEKNQRVKESKTKKEKLSTPIVENEIPFDLPEGWIWCRLQDVVVSDITYGIIKLGDEDNDGVKVLRCSDVKLGFIDASGIRTVSAELSKEYSRTILQGGEIVVNVRGTLGGVAIASEQYKGYNIAREVAMVRCSNQIAVQYILCVLMSPIFATYLSENLRGIAYKGLNMNLLSMFVFPLPPLAEQHRIVEKVGELMSLCDKLESAEKELDKLEANFSEYLPKSILQAAVEGKLVPQNIHDGTASELLKYIRQEKAKLTKAGKNKKGKSLSPIAEEEIPYDPPNGWAWCRLGEVCDIYTGNSINSSEKSKKYTGLNSGRCYIGTKDVGFNHDIDYENGIKIPNDLESFREAPKGSVLLCIEGGSAGRKIGITNRTVCFGNKLCCLTPVCFENKYLYYYLQSPVLIDFFKQGMTGIIGGVSVNSLAQLPIALPPLAEQQRIVAKVDELMALCDALKAAHETPVSNLTAAKVIPFPQPEDEPEMLMAARGKMPKAPSKALQDARNRLLED